MNKYLEKLASMDERVGRVDKPLQAKAPGSELARGAKTIFNKVLLKKADLDQKTKKDLANTAVIGTAGGLTGMAANRILHGPGVRGEGAKAFAISTGIGLIGDYAAVKANKVLNKNFHKLNTN